MVFGTVIVTLVYEPVVDLAAVRLGWVLIIAAAVASALAAVALAVNRPRGQALARRLFHRSRPAIVASGRDIRG
jgi:hypothetical protein